jgi:hypothetical protein
MKTRLGGWGEGGTRGGWEIRRTGGGGGLAAGRVHQVMRPTVSPRVPRTVLHNNDLTNAMGHASLALFYERIVRVLAGPPAGPSRTPRPATSRI